MNDHLVLLLFTIRPSVGIFEFKDVPTDSHYASRQTEKSVILLAQQSHGRTRTVSSWITLLLSAAVVALSACQRKAEVTAPEVRPVRTIAVALQPVGETVVLTGHIEAEHEAGLGFRISGRMVERLVNVGNRVAPGQVLARLDPQDEQNGLRSAQVNLAAAQGQLTNARNSFERQKRLLARGVASRADFDHAQEALQTAQARADDAEAQVKIASDRLSFTELKADAAGMYVAWFRVKEPRAREGALVAAP